MSDFSDFDYLKTRQFFAQVASGIEAAAEKELAGLGASGIRRAFRGFHFSADAPALYRINYQSRLVTRVLAPLKRFECRNREDLYREGRTIAWGRFFSNRKTFAIFANVSGNTQIRHSKFAALCLKDAVADHFRNRTGVRPNVHPTAPDVWINLFIEQNQAVISLDTSGGSLHRRGYRRKSTAAPMKETLAAAMVTMAEWDGVQPLYDPMCGSGTLLCEALMSACRIPAGYLNPAFGFRHLPDFDAALWEQVKRACDTEIRPFPSGLIAGSDIDAGAVEAARQNLAMLPDGRKVRVVRTDFKQLPPLNDRLILCNPPYGIRMQSREDLGRFYQSFGDHLKQRCKGSRAVVFFGNREMIKKIGLKTTWKQPVGNAGIDSRIVRYDLY